MLKLNVKHSFEKIGPLPFNSRRRCRISIEGCSGGVNSDFADETQIERKVFKQTLVDITDGT